MRVFRAACAHMCALFVAFSLWCAAPLAWADTPAVSLITAPLVTPTNAWTYYGAGTTHTTGVAAWPQTPPEIAALGRSLGANRLSASEYSQNVFDYVRNNIAVEFRFGLGKGGRGALIDQSGTPFDQVELTVTLLRYGGVTATYQVGAITLTPSQFGVWTGLVTNLNQSAQTFSVDALAACQFLADGGIPATVNGAGACGGLSGNLTTVTLGHIWVSANGLLYDPSYKQHTLYTGIDLPAAMGCGTVASPTCGTAITTAAISGSSTGTQHGAAYRQTLNGAALTSTLSAQANGLQTAIQNSDRFAHIAQVVGGARVNADYAPPLAASLPYSSTLQVSWSGDIPDQYRTTIRVRLALVDQIFFADELGGRRLRMVSPNEIFVDSTGVTTPACTTCVTDTFIFDVNHPYAADSGSYADKNVDLLMVGFGLGNQMNFNNPSFPMTILHGFGGSGPSAEQHVASLQDVDPLVGASSDYCGGRSPDYETYVTCRNDAQPIIGARLLSQGSASDRIAAGIGQAPIIRHHDIGVIYAQSGSPTSASYMTLDSSVSVVQATNDSGKRTAVFETSAGLWATLEPSVMQQMDDGPAGFSAPYSIWGTGALGYRVFDVPSGSMSTFLAGFNRSAAVEARMQAAANAGYNSIVPDASAAEVFFQSGSVAYTILAAMKGGGSGVIADPARAVTDSTRENEAAAQRRNYLAVSPADATLTFTPEPDLVTGAGAFPMSLSFQRRYDSSGGHSERLQTINTSVWPVGGEGYGSSATTWIYAGPDSSVRSHLGGGWNHNLNVIARYTNNGDRALGSESALDAAGPISSIYSHFDAVRSATFDRRLAAAGALDTLQRQLVYNSVNVDVGGSVQSFQRLPDGSFNPQGASPARLSQSGERLNFDYTPITLTYTGGDGDVINFTWLYYTQQTPRIAPPVFKANSWTFPDGVVVTFNYVFGQLLPNDPQAEMPLWNGYVLQSVSNNLGRSLTLTTQLKLWPNSQFGYGYDYVITRVTDETGRHADFSLSSCPTDTHLLCNTFSETAPDTGVWRYTYQAGVDSPDPALPAGPRYHLRRWHLPTNLSTPYETIAYDEMYRVRTVTDILANATNYYAGGLFSERRRRSEFVDALGAATVRTFDARANALSERDPLSRTTTHAYDEAGRRLMTINPEGDQIRWRHDVRGNVTETCRVPKDRSSLPLDQPCSAPAGDIISTAAMVEGANVFSCVNAASCNKVDFEVDGRGFITDYSWASVTGLLTRVESGLQGSAPSFTCAVVDPYNNVSYPTSGATYCPRTDITYSLFGPGGAQFRLPTQRIERISSVDATGLVTTYGYTGSRYVLQSAIVDAGGLNLTTGFTFDALGNVTAIDGPRTDVVDVTNFAWDANRRLTRRTDADPDAGGALPRPAVRLNYDTAGALTSRNVGTSTNGTDFTAVETTLYEYDALARVTKVTSPASITQWRYDAVDRILCSAIRMNGAVTSDACQATTPGANGPDRIARNIYDLAGQLLTDQRAVDTSIVQDYATYQYSLNGQRRSAEDANDNRSVYVYDGFDRLCRLYFPVQTRGAQQANTGGIAESALTCASGGVNPDYEQYGYDAADNRTSLRVRSGETIAYIYDPLGREIVKDVPGGSSADVSSAYDSLGRRLWARFGSASGSGTNFLYDRPGRLLEEVSYGRTVAHQYNAAGNRTRMTYPGGAGFIQYTYDALNRMDQVGLNGDFSGDELIVDYGYDSLGRRSAIARGSGSASAFSYDGASRLASLSHDINGASPNDVTLTFTYNPASQALTRNLSNDNYVYNAPALSRSYERDGLNRYASVSGVGFAYADGRGNLTSDGVRSFSYDLENRLLSVSGSSSMTLSYDPLGRLRETTGGSVTQFVYDGDRLIVEYGGSGQVQRRFVHGSGIDEPVMWYEGDGFLGEIWLYSDHQGSIIATSYDGGTSQALAYGPYGEPANDDWTWGRFRYTGQIALPEARLFHYKARVYDPYLGRFLQTDPVGYSAGDMNLYAYVGNDPLNRSDPSGLLTCSPSAAGGASDAGGQAKCDTVVQDAQRASAALRNTQQRLNNLASGRNNRETRQTRAAFERVYGRGSATAENVGRVAEAAGAAADWLDSPDTQAVLAGAGGGDAYASVPNPGASTVSIYDAYFGSAGRERSGSARAGSLIHEGGHGGAGMPRHYPFFIEHPNGGVSASFDGAYRAAGIRAYGEQFGTDRLLNQADALRCAVQSMSSTCPQ